MGCAPVRRGLGRTEVVIILVVIASVLVVGCFGTALLGGLLLPALAKAQRNARSMKDSAQIKLIHQSYGVFGREFSGTYPTPSLLAATHGEPAETPLAELDRDWSLDHSANFYSMVVMQNLLSPDVLVSPIEVSDHVVTKADYDYSAYSPADGVFWDGSFVMHIHDPAIGANASYAHITLVGDRRKHWRDTSDGSVPVFGTRAPRGGATFGPEYDRSPTLELHGGKRQWVGNICFNDNHMETLSNFYPQLTTYEDPGTLQGQQKDNIFAADFSHPLGNQAAADAFLSIYISATEFTVEDVYDPLE